MTFFQPGADASDTSQPCPICGIGQPASSRYPDYLCDLCAAQASDEAGRLLSFGNIGIGGGFIATYLDTEEERASHVCYVRGVSCWADEARFGGIVIQPQPKQMPSMINSWHVAVAAESLVACLFARIGYDVSVQYGANQPEYDLMIARGDQLAKVSVKGSKDGSWGLTQKYLRNAEYHDAILKWEATHSNKVIFALVQFQNVSLDQLPRVYMATPAEIARRLRETARGRGDTILYEHKAWTAKAHGAGTIDAVPPTWRFSEDRIERLMNEVAR